LIQARSAPARPLDPQSEAATLHDRAAVASWLAATLAGASSSAPPPVGGPPPLAAALSALADADATPGPGRLQDRLLDREEERVRLFVNAPGGVPAPPYGSWWREGQLAGETTADVAAWYREDGLEPGRSPADWLPAELEYLQVLLQHQRAALLTGSDDLARDARAREAGFLEAHVAPWLPRFITAVREAALDPYWRAVADALDVFARLEREQAAG